MITSKSISDHPTPDLRHKLRWRRRVKLGQSLWRFVCLTGLTSGLVWAIAHPVWLIQNQSQIQIQGNHFLKQDTVLSLLPINYPQSLWRISTPELITKLEEILPVENVELTRSILPPQLTITLQEREPVALVISSDLPQTTTTPSLILVGFVDREGVLIPEYFYHPDNFQDSPLKLKLIGFQSQHQGSWQVLYQFLENSSIQVTEVDWRDPNILILKTNLGEVRCGNYLSQLSEQLTTLSRLKSLPEKVDLSEINYIDLTNPSKPAIKANLKKTK